ncbi:MAG: O-antigen ligase family protein [Kiritimatiellaceae bacterium]|nr:O-antigen ligase family protein [Kiritimatiellaceae bacterium]
MNNPPNSQMLTIWGFVLVFFGAILYFVSKGQFIHAGVAAALIPLLTLAHSPGKWWLVAVMLSNSGLVIPGAATKLAAPLLASAGFIGLSLLDRISHGTKLRTLGSPQRMAGALVLLLVCLASYRGWGLKFLGSANWGGMQYIQLMVGLLFFFYSRQVKVGEKWLSRAIMLYFGLALLPTTITLLALYIPALSALGAFIEIEKSTQFDPSAIGAGIKRVQSLHMPATVLSYFALLLFDRNLKVSWKVLGVGAGSFVLAGMSGHRVVIVKMGLLVAIYAVIRWRKIPQAVKLKGAVAGLCLLASIYAFAQFLPLGFQRSLSVLPGITVGGVARGDAQNTSDWRIEMWRKALPMIPEYLLIGRGSGFNLKEAYGAYTLASDTTTKHEFFIATHSYHNGPLWALVDLGAPGAFLVFGFMVTAIIRYGRRLTWNHSPFMGSAYAVFYSVLISYFIFFLAVFGYSGDVIQMALLAAILEVISEQVKGASKNSQTRTEIRSGWRSLQKTGHPNGTRHPSPDPYRLTNNPKTTV